MGDTALVMLDAEKGSTGTNSGAYFYVGVNGDEKLSDVDTWCCCSSTFILESATASRRCCDVSAPSAKILRRCLVGLRISRRWLAISAGLSADDCDDNGSDAEGVDGDIGASESLRLKKQRWRIGARLFCQHVVSSSTTNWQAGERTWYRQALAFTFV